MKLIIAIIQDEDASEVISHLNEAKFQVTRLSTKGGFLRAGNTTIMTGVEDEKVEGALKTARRVPSMRHCPPPAVRCMG